MTARPIRARPPCKPGGHNTGHPALVQRVHYLSRVADFCMGGGLLAGCPGPGHQCRHQVCRQHCESVSVGGVHRGLIGRCLAGVWDTAVPGNRGWWLADVRFNMHVPYVVSPYDEGFKYGGYVKNCVFFVECLVYNASSMPCQKWKNNVPDYLATCTSLHVLFHSVPFQHPTIEHSSDRLRTLLQRTVKSAPPYPPRTASPVKPSSACILLYMLDTLRRPETKYQI